MDPEKTLEDIFATVNSLHEIAKSEEAVASLAKQMKESLKQLDAEWKATRDAELKKKDEAEANTARCGLRTFRSTSLRAPWSACIGPLGLPAKAQCVDCA